MLSNITLCEKTLNKLLNWIDWHRSKITVSDFMPKFPKKRQTGTHYSSFQNLGTDYA